jgi:hypothetical protein
VEPGDRALHYPSLLTQPGAVLGPSPRDDRLDPTLAHERAVFVVIVAAVGDEWFRPGAQQAVSGAHRRYGVDQRDQLRNVVAMPTRHRHGQRQATSVGQDVVLTPRAGTVDRRRPGVEPPKRARTWLESTAAPDQSISPARSSSARRP